MNYFSFDDKIIKLAQKVQEDIKDCLTAVDEIAEINTRKVLSAFQKFRVSDTFFAGTTGYGYGDKGRDVLDEIYAEIFNTESAVVRAGFVSGTHAISCALFGALRPCDTLLSATGRPYDTLLGVIGGKNKGSLKDYGINYRQVELLDDGSPDLEAIASAASDKNVKAVLVQRSRGYSSRPALSVSQIGQICTAVKRANKNANVIVDNCYGEFVETSEPTDAGADLVVGSLIKNPGGGLAPSGGYIAGRNALVEAASMRFTAPGIGKECGASLGNNRLLYQGLFMAPHAVAQALKTAIFCARIIELSGYETAPSFNEPRKDIIQTIKFGNPEALKRFCKGIQLGAPVDSFVTPEPWDMPGYNCQVIMAAGAFIQGASIELSADGPMREPYIAYMQGGLTYESGKTGILLAVSELMK